MNRLVPVVTLLVVVVVAALLALAAGRPSAGDATTGSPVRAGRAAVPAPAPPRGLEVIRGWDVRRAAAWARGDLPALRRLYLPGSRTGRRDLAMLRRYVARGLRVRELCTQLLAVRARSTGSGDLRLDLTDRLCGGRVVGPDGTRLLPSDLAERRIIDLVRRNGVWVVAEVSRPARRPTPRARRRHGSGSRPRPVRRARGGSSRAPPVPSDPRPA